MLSVVQKLKDIRNNTIITATIPSINQPGKFLPISAKQQKDLIKYTLDAQNNIINLQKEINNIVLQNSIDEHAEYFLIDRYAIMIELRKASLGNIVTQNDKQYDLNLIDINKCISNIPNDWPEFSFTEKGITITCNCPSIRAENKFLEFVNNDIKKISNEKSPAELISVMYAAEICKFITSLSIDDETILFDNINYGDRKTIVDNLPIEVNQKVLDYIRKVREVENSFLTINGDVIPLEALFFITS